MEAKEKLAIDDFQKTMEGIWSSTINLEIIDEAQMTYKNMEDIVSNITPTAEIVKIFKPIYNYKSDEAKKKEKKYLPPKKIIRSNDREYIIINIKQTRRHIMLYVREDSFYEENHRLVDESGSVAFEGDSSGDYVRRVDSGGYDVVEDFDGNTVAYVE